MTHIIERRNGTNESAPYVNNPFRALTLNASPDILTLLTGSVVHDGTKTSLSLADGTVGAKVIIGHPRPLSWLGGRLTYRVVAQQTGETTSRLILLGFSNGDQIAAFLIFNGEVSISYGEIDVNQTTLSRAAGFARALPTFDPTDVHEYEVSIGLDGRIAWCIDGVEVYAATASDVTRLAIHPVMHTGYAIENFAATSGVGTFDILDEEWSCEHEPKGNVQTIRISHSDSAGDHVSCVGLDPSLTISRLARLVGVRGTTPTAIANLNIFTSRVAPDDTLAAVEAGHPLALISNTAAMNAMTFSAGDRIVDLKAALIPDVVNDIAIPLPPEIALPVYGGTEGVGVPTAQPVYLYVVASTTAGAGNTYTELTFEIE